jgi:hypothetical protein
MRLVAWDSEWVVGRIIWINGEKIGVKFHPATKLSSLAYARHLKDGKGIYPTLKDKIWK